MLGLFGINKYALIGMGALIVVLSGICWFLFNENQNLNQSIATFEANIATISKINENLNDTIKNLESQREIDQIRLSEISEKINTINEERNKAIKQLNDYRQRIGNLAQKKPTLIGRYATRATNNLMWEFTCASGYRDKDRCDGTSPSSDADVNSTATGP